jgi:hypothetical protein
MGHVVMENCNGLAVAGTVSEANGSAERCASEAMLKDKARRGRRITIGEDKAYDTADHIAALRAMNVTPHVAQNDSLTKTCERRRMRSTGVPPAMPDTVVSQTCRAMTECIFGCGKQHGTMRSAKHRGLARVGATFLLNLIAYNLVRLPKLLAA